MKHTYESLAKLSDKALDKLEAEMLEKHHRKIQDHNARIAKILWLQHQIEE